LPNSPAALRFWPQSAAPRYRVSAAKEPQAAKPLGVRRSSNLGFGPSSGGVGGTGSRPVRLNSATQQVTPLPRQLRLCIARTICSYHSRFGRKSAILQGVLGRGEDHAPFSVVVVCRPRVVGPCLFWLECLGAEVRRPTVCAPLRNGLPVGKANSALHVRSWWLQVRVMLGS
jgi:hypothetical protein